MADRVAFIGGNTSGRDHFPWAVPDEPGTGVYPDSYFPITISFADAMAWVWRVKKWRLTGDISFDVTRDSDSAVGNFVASYDCTVEGVPGYRNSPPSINREAELVDLQGFNQFEADASSITNGFPDARDPDPDFNGAGLILMDVGYPSLVWKGADQFRPQIYLISEIAGNPDADRDVGSFWRLLFSPVVDADPLLTETIASGLTWGGYPMNLYWGQSTDLCSVSNVTSDLSIDPVEFWPYAARDTTPIYNTSTGAQLQSPFN